MAPSIFLFGRNQDYYTSTARKVIDAIIGFIVGWMGLGFGLWWMFEQMTMAFIIIGAVVLVAAVLSIMYSRKWLGIAIVVGAILTSLFFAKMNGYL